MFSLCLVTKKQRIILQVGLVDSRKEREVLKNEK